MYSSSIHIIVIFLLISYTHNKSGPCIDKSHTQEVRHWCNGKCLPLKLSCHRFKSENQPLQKKWGQDCLPITSPRPHKSRSFMQ